ncbi:hypothetical protein EON66_09845 [archaeon]|nr:MAG: hypothetical protein EON66_09845 [archaeon]
MCEGWSPVANVAVEGWVVVGGGVAEWCQLRDALRVCCNSIPRRRTSCFQGCRTAASVGAVNEQPGVRVLS